jgi:hypothetical protein
MCESVVDAESVSSEALRLWYVAGLESKDSVWSLGEGCLSGVVGILWNSKAGGIERTPSIEVGIKLSGGIV